MFVSNYDHQTGGVELANARSIFRSLVTNNLADEEQNWDGGWSTLKIHFDAIERITAFFA